MEKILVFSDPHLTAPLEASGELDRATRLGDALDQAALAYPDAVRAVICGDLVHNGRPDEYDRLRALLADRPWPVTLMLGNHDARGAFRNAFPQAEVDPAGFVQSAHRHGGVTLICLDTLDEAAEPLHSGVLCPARLEWLDQAMAEAPGGVVVFGHHPPVETGFDTLDVIALRNRVDVMARLAASGKVLMVVAGHVHRSATIISHGLPVVLVTSIFDQMPMRPGVASAPVSTCEPAGYGVLLADADGAILHHVDFADRTLPGA